MGRLLFLPTGASRSGKIAAERYFNNEDGVLIGSMQNLDTDECLFNLDVWEVDFSPLSRWPVCKGDAVNGFPIVGSDST